MTRIDIHNHTRYSNLRLRDALPTPKQLIDRAIELGLSGISISDHESLSAHIKANQYALEIKKQHPNFKVILGNEIYLVDERPSDHHWHFVLTAKDAIGHKQMRELSTLAWLNSYNTKGMTRVDLLKSELKEIIEQNPGHLIGSTACIGSELGFSILELTAAEQTGDNNTSINAHNRIVNFILWCKELFKEDFYIEAQPGISKEQVIVNKRLCSIAKCFEVKMIPTSDSHYLKPEDRYVHKAFLNSENKEREVDAFYQDAYLHSNEEMVNKFSKSGYEEDFILEMFKNSMEIYDKIEFYSLAHTQQVPSVEVPYTPITSAPFEVEKYSTLKEMYSSKDNIDRYWVNTCVNKLKTIKKFNDNYLAELEEEAEVKRIVGERLNTNMFSYPICLAHYMNLIWECGSSVGVGRGSACSALNHYLLGITQLDPLECNFPFFRYMNRDTDGLGDIDIDVCPSKVQEIISKIRKERGEKFNSSITNPLIRESLGATYVCTFGSESTKSAIQTACRGYRSEEYPDGIDNDTAQYLSSLVPNERGFVWSIEDVVYGNEELGRKPSLVFINEINQFPGLLDIIIGIEGNISRRGRHASGVLFMGEDPFEFNAFMKTPSGEIVTQYDLHDAEWAGSVKMDILVTEIQDKIVQSIKLLQEYGEIEANLTIKEAYDKYLHPDVLPMEDKDTWITIQNAASLDLFQLDSEIGRQGAKKVKPDNIDEMSSVNALIRLMTAEKGQETWLDKYVRYKNNREDYKKDISKYNLSRNELKNIQKYVQHTLGIGLSQEQFMRTVMDKDICNFSLKEANKGRKVISKKKMSEIPLLKEQIYKKAINKNVADYVWDYIVAPGLGYSFSDIHSLSYSYIGFQSAYIATHWNPIYWNCACLIVNSGALEEAESEIVNIYEKEDMENFTYKDLPDRTGKIKEKTTDYAKMAKALGDITSKGIKVSLVDINKSDYGFKPDITNNQIMFGMKALSGMNGDTIEKIKAGRPYKNIKDFMVRCPLTKTQMVSLIKAGSFDEVDAEWAETTEIRYSTMAYYLSIACEPKKRLTLQNVNMLIEKELLPSELKKEQNIFLLNKFLKKNKIASYYTFPNEIYNQFIDELEEAEPIGGYMRIESAIWDNKYKSYMDPIRDWIKANHDETLYKLNQMLMLELWEKYAKDNISAWEMESMCSYYHEHELAHINNNKYGFADFSKLPEQPEVDYFFKRNGRQIPIYKTEKIIGTVISKNDNRSSVSILTLNGVVNVKFTREYYAMFNKQISEVQADGTKKVKEKGWFTRGTKIMVTGFRRDDQFVGKTYKNTPTHQLYKITEVNADGSIELIHDRYGQGE